MNSQSFSATLGGKEVKIETGKLAKIMRGDEISDIEKELSCADGAEEVVLMPISVGQRILGIAALVA